MIQICYGLMDRDGRYSKFVGLSIMSILQNSQSQIQIHILHDSTLSNENLKKLLAIDPTIKFYNLEKIFPNLNERIEHAYQNSLKHHSAAAFYRLLIPEVIDVSKAIYLDCDTIINLDIAELWNVDLGNFPIAAKPEHEILPFEIPSEIRRQIDYEILYPKPMIKNGSIRSEDYFNSGVMILNLDLLRDFQTFEKSLKFSSEHPECKHVEQDPLNFLFANRYLKLESYFDIFTWQLRKFLQLTNSTIESGDCIFHFGGMDYGFDKNFLPDRLFMQFLFRSPWALDSFKNLFDYAIETADKSKFRYQKLINFHGSRIYFAPKNLIETLKDFFPPNQNDLILDSTTPIDELIELLRQNRICIFLFEFAKQSQIFREILESHGFFEDETIFDTMKLLTKSQGISTGTRNFVRRI